MLIYLDLSILSCFTKMFYLNIKKNLFLKQSFNEIKQKNFRAIVLVYKILFQTILLSLNKIF